MRTIINLTQHAPTPEQIAEGVGPTQKDIASFLNFDALPTPAYVNDCAIAIANFAKAQGAQFAMVGGAPYLMGPLCEALKWRGIVPLFSFTKRVSVETQNSDGSVTKTNVFKHVGWVDAITF